MKKLLLLINLISLKCLAASELYAENIGLDEAKNNMYTPSYPKMFLGMALVIALIYLTGLIYQKLTKVKMTDVDSDKYKPEIVSTVSLGQNKNLHVVKIMGEHILIGSTPNNITFLKEIREVGTYKGGSYGKNG